MRKLKLGGLVAVASLALTTAAVHGAPAPKKKPGSSKKFPHKGGKSKPKSETVYCPANVPVSHAVRAPASWRAFSTIRNYALGVCMSDNASFASPTTKTLSCYYCDAQGTHKIRIDRAYPPGRTQCTKAGRYKFTCR